MADRSFTQTEQGSSVFLWNLGVLQKPDAALFDPPVKPVEQNTLGRGTAVVFDYQNQQMVRRHYQRGGLVRHLIKDIYWGRKLANTRMWREFHLLRELRDLGLPVPEPVAVRCDRRAWFVHRGDLITVRIATSQTLSEYLQKQPLDDVYWHQLGVTLARFHQTGVYHADLNANNILLNEAKDFYLIDFDKGEKRRPAPAWQQANLQRLQRSLLKLQRIHSTFHFSATAWDALQTGYRQTGEKAAGKL